MKRAILVVLDSVGVGELQDAKSYGDEGSHTLDHVYKACNGLEIKELEKEEEKTKEKLNGYLKELGFDAL